MSIFERGLADHPNQAEQFAQASARLEAAQTEAIRLRSLRAYREAQLDEMMPDLETEARLSIHEELARLDLEEAQLSSKDDSQIQERVTAHKRALDELTVSREKIAARDAALRSRFSIPDDVHRI